MKLTDPYKLPCFNYSIQNKNGYILPIITCSTKYCRGRHGRSTRVHDNNHISYFINYLLGNYKIRDIAPKKSYYHK